LDEDDSFRGAVLILLVLATGGGVQNCGFGIIGGPLPVPALVLAPKGAVYEFLIGGGAIRAARGSPPLLPPSFGCGYAVA
jgi:hypothetical protein